MWLIWDLCVWLYKCLFTIKQNSVLSVNYHFTRVCNYKCGFCFHTAKNKNMLTLDEAKRGVKLLCAKGMQKLNFAGGEPFLYPKFVGELAKYCKTELNLSSVSIVSNGSKINAKWFKKYGQYINILAISCDSFVEDVNKQIGRVEGAIACQKQYVKQAQQLCKQYGIKFKINTVVNTYNWQEDMNNHIKELNPTRWKVFQVLELDDENSGCGINDVKPFLISKEQFDAFVVRHKECKMMVPESNENMQNSYLILDEEMRFLDCSKGGKLAGPSILKVGVEKALDKSGFDELKFKVRGGIYDW